jgi:hypothetical protein
MLYNNYYYYCLLSSYSYLTFQLKSKITPTYGVKRLGPGLGQTQICGGIKAVNEIKILIF